MDSVQDNYGRADRHLDECIRIVRVGGAGSDLVFGFMDGHLVSSFSIADLLFNGIRKRFHGERNIGGRDVDRTRSRMTGRRWNGVIEQGSRTRLICNMMMKRFVQTHRMWGMLGHIGVHRLLSGGKVGQLVGLNSVLRSRLSENRIAALASLWLLIGLLRWLGMAVSSVIFSVSIVHQSEAEWWVRIDKLQRLGLAEVSGIAP